VTSTEQATAQLLVLARKDPLFKALGQVDKTRPAQIKRQRQARDASREIWNGVLKDMEKTPTNAALHLAMGRAKAQAIVSSAWDLSAAAGAKDAEALMSVVGAKTGRAAQISRDALDQIIVDTTNSSAIKVSPREAATKARISFAAPGPRHAG
jgi:hypothetical protein